MELLFIFSWGCFGPGAFFLPHVWGPRGGFPWFSSLRIPKRCKGVHCVDLGESFPTSIPTSIYYLLANFGFVTAESIIFSYPSGTFSF